MAIFGAETHLLSRMSLNDALMPSAPRPSPGALADAEDLSVSLWLSGHRGRYNINDRLDTLCYFWRLALPTTCKRRFS